jgi:hypothetical protein
MLLSLELNLHISGQVTITPRLEKNNSKIGKKHKHIVGLVHPGDCEVIVGLDTS